MLAGTNNAKNGWCFDFDVPGVGVVDAGAGRFLYC